MAHASTITISPKGNVLLPKEFRDALGSNVVMAEIRENNNIILYPLRDVAGAFKDHFQDPDTPFEKMREIAWTKALAHYKPKK